MSNSEHPLLFEMLKSFVTLAETLNLSHAEEITGNTRQTLRRHVGQLEEIKGGALFEVADRRYVLTCLGKSVLPDARSILGQATAWANGQMKTIRGLQYLTKGLDEENFFFQQQHPVGRAFASSSDFPRKIIEAWATAGGNLEDEALLKVRPYCNIFRRMNGEWLFAEVGDKSSYVSWFGITDARSTIGRTLPKLPAGDLFGALVGEAFDSIEKSESVRLDHVYSLLPSSIHDQPIPASYERVLLGAHFADSSFAMLSYVRRTYDVEIEGVTTDMLHKMPAEFVMA